MKHDTDYQELAREANAIVDRAYKLLSSRAGNRKRKIAYGERSAGIWDGPD